MTKIKFLGAAAILSALIAAPALAQPVIDEPGLFAFYHPNGDLGIGSPRPAADAMASGSLRNGGDMARLRMQSRPVHVKRSQVVKSY